MEFKSFELLECKADEATRRLSGYASVFGNVDSYNDIVAKGAFSRTLQAKQKIPMLWQHDSSDVVGVFDVMEERPKGLYVEGTIADTSMGEDAYKLLKMGAITGLSIGYSVKKYSVDQKKGMRTLEDVELYEVSLVTFPANEKAQVLNVKSADSIETIRQFEDFLKQHGFSNRKAVAIAAKGFAVGMGARDSQPNGDDVSESRVTDEALAKMFDALANFSTIQK